MQVREMLGNGSRGTWFIPMICGSGCSKSRLVKATGAEPPFLHPFCILFVHAALNELVRNVIAAGGMRGGLSLLLL